MRANAPSGIPLLIASATRLSEQDFLRESFLAREPAAAQRHGTTAGEGEVRQP